MDNESERIHYAFMGTLQLDFRTNEYGEERRRLFVPANDPGRSLIPPHDLVVYNQEKEIQQLMFKPMALPEPKRDEQTMVVHIDGACRGNGTPNARAACGVYFGPGSRYNTWSTVPKFLPQTSTRAEIEALAEALNVIHEICERDFKLVQIKIVTDSAFLVDAMSKWMKGWIDSGGIGSNGKKVAHYERLKELHGRLDRMEYGDDGGIQVQFWHVHRERNQHADTLANAALDVGPG